MTITKLIKRAKSTFSGKSKQKGELKELLKRLKHKHKKLREEIKDSHKKDDIEEMEERMKVIHKLRRKGLEKLKELNS